MNAFTYMFPSLSMAFSRLTDKHMVTLRGIPFSYRVLLNPGPLLKVLAKNGINGNGERITLELGEIDNIAGKTDISTGDIIVDVQEIALAKVPDGDPDKIDYEVTKTLVHELRHRWQLDTYGKFRMLWDKVALFFLFMAVGIYFVWFPLLRYDLGLLFSGQPHLMAFSVIAGYFLYRFFLGYLSTSAVLSYRWCWCERDARRYAEEKAGDPEWRDVITVEVSNAIDPNVSTTSQEAVERLFKLLLGGRRMR